MHAATKVPQAVWWRAKAAELRTVADRTNDPDLRCRLFDLADHWDALAEDLDSAGSAPRFH